MSRLDGRRQATQGASRRRVLFVCIGNSCRSQMAEGFARAYGGDVMEAASGGLFPALSVAPVSAKVMKDRGIDLRAQFPKSVYEVAGPWDLVVNMSGAPLGGSFGAAEVRTWPVRDPVADPEEVHHEVATRIEGLVMQLIVELRSRGGASVD